MDVDFELYIWGLLVVKIIIGVLSYYIAVEEKRELAFFLGFFLGIIGIIIVLVINNNGTNNLSNNNSNNHFIKNVPKYENKTTFDKLVDLKELKDADILTEEEYEVEKKKILNK